MRRRALGADGPHARLAVRQALVGVLPNLKVKERPFLDPRRVISDKALPPPPPLAQHDRPVALGAALAVPTCRVGTDSIRLLHPVAADVVQLHRHHGALRALVARQALLRRGKGSGCLQVASDLRGLGPADASSSSAGGRLIRLTGAPRPAAGALPFVLAQPYGAAHHVHLVAG
eukprot:6054465-Prymnesium_polylepis.1